MAEKNSEYEEMAQPEKSTNWAAIVLGLILAAVIFLGAFYLIQQSSSDQPDVVVGVIEAEIEQPPAEPIIEAPVEQPSDLPQGGGGLGKAINDICASAGLASGVVIFGGYSVFKKRKTE